MRLARWPLAAALVATAAGATAHAQGTPPRITVQVRQVAGTSVYLDVGARNGVAVGDTLTVLGDAGTVLGTLVVTAGTDTRSVLTFAGTPFPVTRGMGLTLQLLREPEVAPAEPAPPMSAARAAVADAPAQALPSPERPVRGRVAWDMSATRSVTQVGQTAPETVARTFATPALRLDLTAPDAVGPLEMRTDMRIAYRYSAQDLVQPPTSARVYEAALEGDVGGVRVAAGRFRSSAESYSGYWDGALVRFGGEGPGVGAIVGFQPDRWNERPSTAVPKASVFVDDERHGEGWRWSADVSAHTVRPRDGTVDHTFFGASQRISVGALRVSHDLQLDHDPSGGWRISRLRVSGSVRVSRSLELRGGIARNEAWLGAVSSVPFAPRHDRANLGLGVQTGSGYLSLDGSLTEDPSGRQSWGGTGTFVTPQPYGWRRTTASASAAVWSGPSGSTVTAAPNLSLDLDPLWVRVGYRTTRSDYLRRTGWTHALEGSVDTPLASGLRASARLRLELGGFLSSQSLDFTLYRSF